MRAPTTLIAILAVAASACSNDSKLQDTTSHGAAGGNSDTAAMSSARSDTSKRGPSDTGATKGKTTTAPSPQSPAKP